MEMDLSAYTALSVDGIALKRLSLDNVQIWRKPITNQVPLSIDLDGNVYNGCGYKDGCRLSSSGVIKEQDNSCVSGLIPATNGDVVRASGCDWNTDYKYGQAFYTYIGFYDAAMNWLGAWNQYRTANGYVDVKGCTITESDGVITFVPNVAVDFAYVRFSLRGSGADMIITVNEEIA